jgi:hypothetical protein
VSIQVLYHHSDLLSNNGGHGRMGSLHTILAASRIGDRVATPAQSRQNGVGDPSVLETGAYRDLCLSLAAFSDIFPAALAPGQGIGVGGSGQEVKNTLRTIILVRAHVLAHVLVAEVMIITAVAKQENHGKNFTIAGGPFCLFYGTVVGAELYHATVQDTIVMGWTVPGQKPGLDILLGRNVARLVRGGPTHDCFLSCLSTQWMYYIPKSIYCQIIPIHPIPF